MRKLLWHSVAPIVPTGYGQQTAVFAPRLASLDDYDVAISCGFGIQGSHIKWNGIVVYPGEDWNRTVFQWAMHHGAGEPVTVVTLMDVWPLDHAIYAELNQRGLLACWCPVDHDPAPPLVIDFFKDTNAVPIAMSKFGVGKLEEAGLDPLYVPHGIDTNQFRPHDRDDLRAQLGFPEDAFVVGMVANNQGQSPPRKAFSEAFLAFSIFRAAHENAILYLHCEMSGFRQGLDLARMLTRFDLPEDSVRCSNPVQMEFGMPPGFMAGLYNCFDVLLNPSYGEGFGLPIIEAQACGTPVIVSDWTSMPELCGAGWKVGGVPWDHAMAEAFWLKPDVDEIVDALEQAYAHKGDLALRYKARTFALDYDADLIVERYWKPALDEIHRPREVKPIGPTLNREQRRAKAKAKVA